MGVNASIIIPRGPQVRWYEKLMGWPQETIKELNDQFREAHSGFVVDAEDIVVFIGVGKDVADNICTNLSRNVEKKTVNMMSLLAVIVDIEYILLLFSCRCIINVATKK
jgi:hypothetical protein